MKKIILAIFALLCLSLPVIHSTVSLEDDCGICREPLLEVGMYSEEGKVEISQLKNCNHYFHKGCINTAIEHHKKNNPHLQPNCPFCRKIIPEEDGLKDVKISSTWNLYGNGLTLLKGAAIGVGIGAIVGIVIVATTKIAPLSTNPTQNLDYAKLLKSGTVSVGDTTWKLIKLCARKTGEAAKITAKATADIAYGISESAADIAYNAVDVAYDASEIVKDIVYDASVGIAVGLTPEAIEKLSLNT